jgi:hypothetical protein
MVASLTGCAADDSATGSNETALAPSTFPELWEALRVGHLLCGLQMGSMPRDKVLYNTQMFAEKVAPALRYKWSDYEDKWYPKMMPPAERALPVDTPYTGTMRPPLRREAVAAAGGGAAQ